MTKQEIFNRVWQVLIIDQGGVPSRTINGACVYRSTRPDGRTFRCAVGALIPDDLYDPDIEGMGIWDAMYPGRRVGPQLLHTALCHSLGPTWWEERDLLSSLQHAHDYCGDRHDEHMAHRLRQVALDHHLTVPGDPT